MTWLGNLELSIPEAWGQIFFLVGVDEESLSVFLLLFLQIPHRQNRWHIYELYPNRKKEKKIQHCQ